MMEHCLEHCTIMGLICKHKKTSPRWSLKDDVVATMGVIISIQWNHSFQQHLVVVVGMVTAAEGII